MAVKQIQTETLAMRELFESYYMMGDARSFRKLADKTNTGFATIKRYSSSFKWIERIKERDAKIGGELKEKTDLAIVNSKQMYRETIRTLTDTFVKDVKTGKIKIRNILDFERVCRLDLEMMGANDGSSTVDNIKTLADALKGSGWDSVRPPEEE